MRLLTSLGRLLILALPAVAAGTVQTSGKIAGPAAADHGTQLAARHPGPVVYDAQRALPGLTSEHDRRRVGVERVRNDLADDRFLEGAWVGVSQILEQVE